MRKIIVLLLIAFLLPLASAVNLDLQKNSENEVMILDLNTPVVFDLNVTNNGVSDDFEFYSFFALMNEPNQSIQINHGETKDVQVKILPTYILNPGFSTFDLFIRGTDATETSKQLTVRIINLKDAFEVGSGDLDPDTKSLEIYVHNKVNFNFDSIDARSEEHTSELQSH